MPPDPLEPTDTSAPAEPADSTDRDVPVERLLGHAADTLPVNFALLDDEGTIRWTNAAWQTFAAENDLAVRPDSLGVNYLDVTACADDESARAIATKLRTLIDGEADVVEVEYPCHVPENQRWFLMRAAPFTLDGERYVTVAHFDITERVASENTLQRFQRAIETAGHAILLTDADGTITYVNPAFEALTGYTSAEAVGANPRLLKSGEMDPSFYEALWETITAGEVWEETIINRRKSGALYWAHQTIAPVLDETGTPVEYVAVQMDLTELREAQSHARKLGNVLRHNLRNQLNVIQGYADLIEMQEGDPAAHAAVISQTVSELLATAQKGQQLSTFLASETTPVPENVAALVRDVCDSLAGAHPTATVSVTAPESATALAVAKLESAIRELVENAIIHGSDESPVVDVTVNVTDDWVEVAVENPGAGVPAMEYEPLTTGASSQLFHDTGFGLNLAYWIVRRSGGHIDFADSEGDAAVVTVRLPRADETATQ